MRTLRTFIAVAAMVVAVVAFTQCNTGPRYDPDATATPTPAPK